MSMWLSRCLLLALFGLVCWPATPARAHAQLLESTPQSGAVLATPPPRLQMLFDEELADDGSEVRVFGPAGLRADRRDRQVDGVRMWISLLDQGPGVYRVRWKAVAGDDKGVTNGAYTFTVQPQVPPGTPQLSVAPMVVVSGQSVTVQGGSFPPGATVVLSVGDAESPLAITRADAMGRVSASATLPVNVPFGRQVVQAVDASGNLATGAVQVLAAGGAGAVAIRLDADADGEEDTVAYTLRLENLSGWHLRSLVLRALIPDGTRVLAADLGQPDGVDPPEVGGGQIVWRAPRLSPHTISGPYAFTVSTSGLPNDATVVTVASVEFAHTASAPVFRGVARSLDVPVQIIR